MNTIYILWLRQMKRFIRTKERVLASIAQPVLFLIALGFGFGPIYHKAGGGDYISFLAPGVIAMSILFTAVFTGMEIIWDKQFGFLKETLVAPVSRITVMLGRTLGGATVAFVQGLVVMLITLVVGFRPALSSLPVAFLFMFLVALVFSALGTAIASRLNDMQGFPLIINFVVMPLYFLSGALFPLEGLTGVFHRVVVLNPLAYGVDGIRGALTGTPYFSLGFDCMVLTLCATVLVGIGAYMFSRIEA